MHRSVDSSPESGSALPPGTRLIHVGLPKTGTTTVQNALDLAKSELRAQGVELPGGVANPKAAGHGGSGFRAGRFYNRAWQELVNSTRACNARIAAISSENFAYALPEDARRVVTGLGGSTAHVVITLRPLGEILPSLWQQLVQSGEKRSYADWLDDVLSTPPRGDHENRHWIQVWQQRFIERWAACAGSDRTTLVIVDSADQGRLLRDFESLLGVAEGTLAMPEGGANRSLTLAETEFIRECYAALAGLGWKDGEARRHLLAGSVQRMQAARPEGAGRDIITPAWAQERAAQLGMDLVSALPELGVRVVGDPARLVGSSHPRHAAPLAFQPSMAVEAVVGALEVAREMQEGVTIIRSAAENGGRTSEGATTGQRTDRVLLAGVDHGWVAKAGAFVPVDSEEVRFETDGTQHAHLLLGGGRWRRCVKGAGWPVEPNGHAEVEFEIEGVGDRPLSLMALTYSADRKLIAQGRLRSLSDGTVAVAFRPRRDGAWWNLAIHAPRGQSASVTIRNPRLRWVSWGRPAYSGG